MTCCASTTSTLMCLLKPYGCVLTTLPSMLATRMFVAAQYNSSFYLGYLSNWPAYQLVVESPAGRIMAYIIGKAEGKGKNWHGHVSAVTVAPEYRRLGLARLLMADLEHLSEHVYVICGILCLYMIFPHLDVWRFARADSMATLWTCSFECPTLSPLPCTRSLATSYTDKLLITTLAKKMHMV